MDTPKKKRNYVSIPATPQFQRDLDFLERDSGESTATVIRSAVASAADERRLLRAQLALEEASAAYVNQDGDR